MKRERKKKIKWKASRSMYYNPVYSTIQNYLSEIEYVDETDAFLIVVRNNKLQKISKRTTYDIILDTKEEAISFLNDQYKKEIARLQESIQSLSTLIVLINQEK